MKSCVLLPKDVYTCCLDPVPLVVWFRNVSFLQIKHPRIISGCVNAVIIILSCEVLSLFPNCCCKVG